MAFVAPCAPSLRSCRRPRTRPLTRASAAPTPPHPVPAFDLPAFEALLYDAQAAMCRRIERLDGAQRFSANPWTSDTGAGNTRVLQNGPVFEKAGVNVSAVRGLLSAPRAAAMASRGRPVPAGTPYRAAALSFVLHPRSPFVPTLRGDVRVFVAAARAWAGGGADLTVCYVDRPAVAAFHRFWRAFCDAHDPAFYPRFKRSCDDYFYLPSRAEHRGVGGIFYDDLALPPDALLRFQAAVLARFLPSFEPILAANLHKPWTHAQKRWQRIRRGRYLEFNLLNDRGVRFGLAPPSPDARPDHPAAARHTASRTESIMISAPPSVEWPYAFAPQPGSPEEETLHLLQSPPIDWANIPDVAEDNS